ncbi:site-specific integrase [Vibrio sp. SM6]|uniref:Site-specific integrase n=1 Tax=Vibrio agarilyticus TaxID=2726741 RepID=A0A7X8TTX7_9VIBR|nr:DUF3596 domain-containing protein [Vibrio agarilyticus]NLS14233.1 site-specific integrase [Vibrio agarilyticus]
MGSVNSRNGKLYIDFRYQGVRCREQTALPDTQVNQRKIQKLLKQLEADMRLGCFVYSEYFPQSNKAASFAKQDREAQKNKQALLGNYKTALQELQGIETILFEDFAQEWFDENSVRWKQSYQDSMKVYLWSYLVPHFGEYEVGRISRPDILKYRASLVKPRDDGKVLSAEFINHVMTPLRMILAEAADRYEFRSTFENIKPLRVERRNVNPFDLDEVNRFLSAVRSDYKNYFTTRFFTGMRTSEIDGLKWKYVDLKRRLISIRETHVQGRQETTKTTRSTRDILISSVVLKALESQWQVSGDKEFVFCNAAGKPLDKGNIRDRIWKPTLERLGMPYRRPYETRHTAATLWLAAGEAPEWIAHQMGHTTTKMLFDVYSRYVPNLTRQDGSAFEKLLGQSMNTEDNS